MSLQKPCPATSAGRLFYTPNSPYARKCRVVAIEKGLADKIEFVKSDPWDNAPELLAVNPMAKVPALLTDNGMAICDSPVICEYLDSLSEEPKLIPSDMNERIQVLALAALADGIIDEAVAWVIETMRRPEDKRWPMWIKRKEEGIKRTLVILSEAKDLIDSSPSAQDDINIATINLAVALSYVSFRMPHLNWREEHSKLANWLDNFSKRDSMLRTEPLVYSV